MSQFSQWHLPKSNRVKSKEELFLMEVFGEKEVVTKCGLTVQIDQLRTYEQYIADEGSNSEMWCPFCFGG